MKTSDALDKIAPALVAALADMTGVAKDSKNAHFKNSYASLESVIDTARPLLKVHGLAFMQGLGEYVNGAMTVSTRILHESGQWIESDFQMPVGKPDPQGTASASTYARRYALMSILGLPSVDDDGEAAMPRNQPKDPAKKTVGGINPTVSIHEDGPDWFDMNGEAGMSAAQAKKDGWGETFDGWLGAVDMLPTMDAMRVWYRDHHDLIKPLPLGWRKHLRGAFEARKAELG